MKRHSAVVVVPDAATKILLAASMILAGGAAISCKREQRTFRVAPSHAKTTSGIPNTPFAAGLRREPTTRFESPAPAPDLVESNAYELAEGQRLYRDMNCAGCHALHGGGAIGPALSDEEWIYGWQPPVIFDTIVFGRPNGMPSFAGKIPDRQVWQLVDYVRSLSGLVAPHAAPGRGDDMAGATPPNSIERRQPRSSTQERDDLRRQASSAFQRLGWVDPSSDDVGIPETVVRAVARESTTRPSSGQPLMQPRARSRMSDGLASPGTEPPARRELEAKCVFAGRTFSDIFGPPLSWMGQNRSRSFTCQ